MPNLLIVPAAGMGRRLGRGEPKALTPLAGRPMIDWTLDALKDVSFARVVVAAPPGREADFEVVVAGRADVIAGGETRSLSVRLAFQSLNPSSADFICIHDAARPLVSGAETRSVAAGGEVTDEASLLERLGFPIAIVRVSRLGFKVTTPEDLEMAEALLRCREMRIGKRETDRT